MNQLQEPEIWVDDGVNEPETLHLYETTRAAQGVQGFAAVDDAHVAQFLEQGYLVIDDVFSPERVASALGGLLDLIGGRPAEFTGIQFEANARELLPTMPPELRQDVVRKLMGFVQHEPRLDAVAADPDLLAILTRIMGEAPVLFQDQALLKPPLSGREKPWHQDNAFFSLPADSMIVGVWIALDEALPENGCMHVIPGSQRSGPVPHFQRRDWQICDTDVAVTQVLSVPLKPGGCLLFHGLLHHGTPPSRSPLRRRALQFHYKPASVARTDDEERLAVFGSEGKDVTC
ncbi:MAG: phytanoyl-CoA dioxygenase family protein [Thermomicrobiales bacterium]